MPADSRQFTISHNFFTTNTPEMNVLLCALCRTIRCWWSSKVDSNSKCTIGMSLWLDLKANEGSDNKDATKYHVHLRRNKYMITV